MIFWQKKIENDTNKISNFIFSNNLIVPNINNINKEEEESNIYYNKKINLNYFDNKNLLEELRAKYLPDYNIKDKKEINSEVSLSQTDKNNNNDASEGSIQAQKLINEDSSHLNPFQQNIENIKKNSFKNKEEKYSNKEIKNNNKSKENKILENKENIENKENKQIINNNRKNDENQKINLNKNSIKNNDNNNNNIRNKYYTEIISSNILFKGDNAFNPLAKTSLSLMNNYTNAQINYDNNRNKKENNRNIHNKNINIDQKEPNYISFSLKNLNINNSNNNSEIEQNSIHKKKTLEKEDNEENDIQNNNNKNNNSINANIDVLSENIKSNSNQSNNIINTMYHNSILSDRIVEKNNDEYKEYLISENNKLKKEIKNYEQLITPLINYINDLNVKLKQREINPKDISVIVKSDNASFYINNLERNLLNSNKEITEQINTMKNKETYKHHHNHSQRYKKLFNSDNYINNIKVKKLNKSDDDDIEDDENINIRNINRINRFNFGKGNFFYDDRSDKYFYDYYKDRSINCPACIIGNSNSERGFSPIICCHLHRFFNSEEKNKDNLIEN